MANYTSLKDAVAQVIKANGNQEITGTVLRSTLLSIINGIGANRTFAGIATPTTVPGTPDANIFYLAAQPGAYVNFGSNAVVVDTVKVFYNNAGNTWSEWTLPIAPQQTTYNIAAQDSFYQNRTLDKSDRAKWVAAFTGVKVVFNNIVPANYPDIQIAVSLVRRTTETNHELRFKINTGSGWAYIGSSWGNTNSPENANGGATPYKQTYVYGAGTVQIQCAIDWSVFTIGSSIFVDDALDATPYYILSPNNVFLSDLNTFNPATLDLKEKQSNINGSSVKTFVPNCTAWAGNVPLPVYVFKTPYKFANGLNYFFEISAKTSSGGEVGYKTMTISFWGRSNGTFNYYTPKFFWSDGNTTPVRLCVNSDGFICIVIGTDNTSLRTTLGGNLALYIKKVGIDGLGSTINVTPIYDGWSISGRQSLDETYTNVYQAENGNAQENTLQNGYQIKPTPTSIATTFTPLVAASLGGSEYPGYKMKIALPAGFTPSLNTAYRMRIQIKDVSIKGYGITEAILEFWGHASAAWLQYGVIYKDARFPMYVRVGLNGTRYYVLLDGDLWNNTVVTIPEFTAYNNTTLNDTLMSDFVFSTYIEDELADYVTVYTPPVYKNATIDYVNNAISNIGSVVQPVKAKSYAIFGSSKSTTRNAYSGWLAYLVDGLLTLANKTTNLITTGTVANRPYNQKALTNTANGIVGKKITGVGSSLTFTVFGSHVDLVQFIERTTNYAAFDVYDNDVKIGSFNNRNKTMLGQRTQIFAGTGAQKSFVIDHLDSYNFAVTVNGTAQTVSMNPGLSGGDCYAVRTIMTFAPYNDGQPRRILYFPVAPANGATIQLTYNVGRAVGFTQSDFNEDENGNTENTNPVSIASLTADAVTRSGYPLSPVINNPDAVLRFSFDAYGMHRIKIVITGGTNPYFDFDFACAELNNFMNAAFGGYDLARAISESQWHDWRCVRYLPYFDVLMLEYGTNDDRYQIDRVLVREQTFTLEEIKNVKLKEVIYITNTGNTSFATGLCTGTIQEITPFSLTSDDIKTSEIEVGDFIKIGEYRSDWREFAVRTVATVDKVNGVVTWVKPFSVSEIWHYNNLSDMVGAQFAVRRLGQVRTNYNTLIGKFKASNPNAQLLVVGMSAFNTNDYCSGWGYNELQQELADQYNGTFVNISDEQIRFNDGALSNPKIINIPSSGVADYVVDGADVGNVNRAFRVWVNGVDVTGIDAYVERTDGWFVTSDVDPSLIHLTQGQDWNQVVPFATDYGIKPVRVHFYGNVPASGDTIQLVVGGYGWSDDGVHQTESGNQTYGSCILKAITQ